jgi:salicylate hydroxylase
MLMRNRVMAIPREKYQRLLYEAAVKARVDVRLGSRIGSIDESAPAVFLTEGEKIEGDAIIGADGE